MSAPQIIVIGGGLSGLSAAHTVLQAGGRVCLVDKNAFMGGNSTKATSGMNGAGTRTQKSMDIPDSKEQFWEDTTRGGCGVKKGPIPPEAWTELGKTLAFNSADAVHWIQDRFGLALDTTSRLGGHTYRRTHRSKTGGKFPGMEITYALMQAYEKICEDGSGRAKLITKATVTKLLTDASGAVTGVEYKKRKGGMGQENGASVVIATGGYAAGGLYPESSLLKDVRPDLMYLPTTNGKHCTGDGIKIAQAIGAEVDNLQDVQVHPTGLIHPKQPNSRVLFLAAGALRGEGGIIVDRNGRRFCNDLGTRDYVSGMMWKNQGPFRLLLNETSSANIAWHCSHYRGRGVMKLFKNGNELAKDAGFDPAVLEKTFKDYNQWAIDGKDPWGKPPAHCRGTPLSMDQEYNAAIVTPVVHYTMGGLKINAKAEVLNKKGQPIPGLYCAGECAGGVHGQNRLGGSALLECVVFGRVAGDSINAKLGNNGADADAPGAGAAAAAGAETKSAGGLKEYTLEEVAKHNKDEDCWVIVNGQVLDVTEFMDDHPGGRMAIMTFAGRDATEEFNMLHDSNVVSKYAPETVIGVLKPGSKL